MSGWDGRPTDAVAFSVHLRHLRHLYLRSLVATSCYRHHRYPIHAVAFSLPYQNQSMSARHRSVVGAQGHRESNGTDVPRSSSR